MTTVFSWNLHSQRYSTYDWEERLKIIVGEIEKHNPDVIFFQEVEPKMKGDLVLELLNESILKGKEGYLYTHYCLKKDKMDGILVLSKMEIKKVYDIDFNDLNQVSPYLDINRIKFVGVHLKSKIRNYQNRTEHLGKLLSEAKEADVFVGDFNEDVDEGGTVYQQMIDSGFKHVYDLSQKTTKKINHEGDYTHRKIDWIFVREESGLVGESKTVIDQEQMLPSLEDGYPSDHHYLVAKIEKNDGNGKEE